VGGKLRNYTCTKNMSLVMCSFR